MAWFHSFLGLGPSVKPTSGFAQFHRRFETLLSRRWPYGSGTQCTMGLQAQRTWREPKKQWMTARQWSVVKGGKKGLWECWAPTVVEIRPRSTLALKETWSGCHTSAGCGWPRAHSRGQSGAAYGLRLFIMSAPCAAILRQTRKLLIASHPSVPLSVPPFW